ncbi:MAG TPA: sigma-54 dependent transcriptional regulator [Desulfomonilaceae bacterium]|nr:sigma-54 dependent transcriptional regulator [Desulfomonilaceae bacterium]
MNQSIRILVVDDEDSVRKRCVRLLAGQGFNVVGAMDASSAFEMIQDSPCDIMLVDIRMPGMDGMELLQNVKRFDSSIEIIMMTGYGSVDTAVKAMKCGAYDYLTKPFDVDELLLVVKKVVEKKDFQREITQLRSQLEEQHRQDFLVGNSAAMNEVRRFIDKVAKVDCNVLLYGESGTGKELVARCIHGNSSRKDRPFVVADCAALSPQILESELFGHVKGAFTGAYGHRRGYFETAEGGTIFLDEIGELPLELQGKLLRVVQECVMAKVGSSDPIKVDARIIAATNRDLKKQVAGKAFREDLFYRLNVVSLTVPPLRDRRDDIPLLVKHLLVVWAAKLNCAHVPRISPEVLRFLSSYDWPGNVRELENAVQRAIVLAENDELSVHHLLPIHPYKSGRDVAFTFSDTTNFRTMRERVLHDFTRGYLESALRRSRGNVTQTATEMGMRRTSLQRLLKQSGLDPETFRDKPTLK